jgi:predicted GNAT family acetyltransferase
VSEDVNVQQNAEQSRFEIRVGGELAGFAVYHLHGDVADFTHTEIDDAFEGEGLGSRLVGAALDQTRAAGHQVLPHCPFVRAYIARHAEYADLVPAEERPRFGL